MIIVKADIDRSFFAKSPDRNPILYVPSGLPTKKEAVWKGPFLIYECDVKAGGVMRPIMWCKETSQLRLRVSFSVRDNTFYSLLPTFL